MNTDYSAQHVVFIDLELTPSELKERWESIMNEDEPDLDSPLKVIQKDMENKKLESTSIWDTI